MPDPITMHSGENGRVQLASCQLLEATQWDFSEKTAQKSGIHFFGDSDFGYTSGGVKKDANGTVTCIRNYATNALPVRSGDLVVLDLRETETATQGWYFPQARVGDVSEMTSGESGDPIGFRFTFTSHGPYYGPGETRP